VIVCSSVLSSYSRHLSCSFNVGLPCTGVHVTWLTCSCCCAGLAQPGKIERGARASGCQNHLHQLHVCLPAGPGRSRLLYRMSMDFLQWTKHVPFIQAFWAHIAKQVGFIDKSAWPVLHGRRQCGSYGLRPRDGSCCCS